MIIIEYTKNGIAYNDFTFQQSAKEICDKQKTKPENNFNLFTSTEKYHYRILSLASGKLY